MSDRKPSALYRVVKRVVRLVYPHIECWGTENLPDEPVIIVGNHSHQHGPICAELYSPRLRYTWCIGQMMKLKEVPDYAFADFWSRKPKSVRWLFRIASYLIAPLSVMVFNNANTIAVYHDHRLMETFRQTAARLSEGADVVVFPEKDIPYNGILYAFQEGFVDAAMFYYRKTGKAVSFVPMYLCPALKRMTYGAPIRFDPSAPLKQERERICGYISSEITRMAVSLPRHRVVPYRNVPRSDYPYNIPSEVSENEKARG